MTDVALAIDIGATKMAVGRVTANGELLDRSEISTDPSLDGPELFARLAKAVSRVAGGTELVCGIGSCGPLDKSGEAVSPLNIPGWRSFPLRRSVEDLLGVSTFLDGDGKALTLAEGWVGGAFGETSFLSMTVSTGVGGGIVLDGRLLDGASGNAGHIGHIVVEPKGRPCPCGGQGCLEAETGGRAIAAITGRPPSEAGDDIRRHAGALVGRAAASVAQLLDLRTVTVAGSVALGFGPIFFTAAQEELDQRCGISYAKGAIIRPSPLGRNGGLIGAAAVGWRGLERSLGAVRPG